MSYVQQNDWGFKGHSKKHYSMYSTVTKAKNYVYEGDNFCEFFLSRVDSMSEGSKAF